MYIKVRKNNKEAIFSGLFLNEDEELEFAATNIDSLKKHTYVFNEEKGTLEVGKWSIKLEEEQVEKLKEIKNETRQDIINLYKKILKGEEDLLFLDITNDKYPYVITSKSILEAKIRSFKYQKALMYVFSEEVLKKYKKKTRFNFKNYEEFQKELGEKIKERSLTPNKKYEGQDVLALKWKQIVN